MGGSYTSKVSSMNFALSGYYKGRCRNACSCNLPSSFSTGKASTNHNNRRLFAQGRWDRELNSTYRSRSSPASSDHQLELTNSSTTDVEPSPGKCQKDRRSHEHEPKVHEFIYKSFRSLRTVGRSRDQQWAVRLVLHQLRPLSS